MIQRLALYATAGLALSVLGLHTNDELFWCVMGLLWAAEALARHDGYNQAVADCEQVLDRAQATLDRAEQLTNKHNQDTDRA